jgi:hypothetical protein
MNFLFVVDGIRSWRVLGFSVVEMKPTCVVLFLQDHGSLRLCLPDTLSPAYVKPDVIKSLTETVYRPGEGNSGRGCARWDRVDDFLTDRAD